MTETPTKHRFYLMEIGPDGPNRLQGTKGYSSMEAVETAAETYLREYPHRHLTIFEAHHTLWVDPRPAIFDDRPRSAAGPTT